MTHHAEPIRPASMILRRPRGNARLTTGADTRVEPSLATQAYACTLRGLVETREQIGICVPGSVEGILTGVGIIYLAHAARTPITLHVDNQCQPALGETVLDIREDEPFARRVLAGFERATSSVDAKRVVYACQDDIPQRASAVFAYMRRGFDLACSLVNYQADPALAPVFKIAQAVSCECERARQFVRFRKMVNGVYCARFEPRANVIPLVLGHFAARFNTQAFVIHDPVHRVAGLWNGRETQLVYTDAPPRQADNLEDDAYYQALWKRFYDSVAIEARTNHDLRRQLMPKRFWKNLPEMNPLVDAAHLADTCNPSSGLPQERQPQERRPWLSPEAPEKPDASY